MSGTRVPSGSKTFRGLSKGNHTVELSDPQVNCTLSRSTSKTVSVAPIETAEATFWLSCPLARFKSIAYRRGTEIWVMDGDGTDKAPLPNSKGGRPAWSPGGTRIAFESRRDGDNEIYTIRPDGTGRTQITKNSTSDLDPTWSPDGSRIAFESRRDGDIEIYKSTRTGPG